MPEYAYEALDKSGNQVRGVAEAANEETILEKLRTMGFYALGVSVRRTNTARDGDLLALPVIKYWFHRIKTRHVMTFSRQLATLIGAGLPIMRSLAVLRQQAESVIFKNKIDDMAHRIEGGSSLSEAMARHPRVFDRLYVNMVRAGEIGGVLEHVLNKIADFQEKRESLKGKIKSAMMYPLAVMSLATLILTFILWKIIPVFNNIFEQIGADLPLPTRILIEASNFLLHQTWMVVVGMVLAVVAFRQVNRSAAGRYLFDSLLLRMPIIGPILRKVAITRFAGTLSTLINAGVPILQALDIVRDSSGNEVIARAMQRVYQSVRDGETIHDPLRECDVFPPLVVHMVAVGEETGTIDLMLTKVAQAYEEEVDNTVNALTSILEPVLIVFLGAIIGVIVIALYLPIILLPGAMNRNL